MNTVKSFHGHFAAAYGTCWLVLQAVAILTFSHIEMGIVGFVGFPLLGIVYALVRCSSGNGHFDEISMLKRRLTMLEIEIERHRPPGS